MTLKPRSSAACAVSTMVTGRPALRKFIAMPPPIVPAPITPTFLMASVGVSSAMSAIFQTCRSAKNTCRCAFDCCETSNSMKAARSRFRPSSMGSSTASRTASSARVQASKPRFFFACALRRPSKISGLPRAGASFSSRSRTFASAAPEAITALANAIAPSRSLPSSTSSSSTPQARACFAENGVPDRIASAAASGPIRRGRRCVPPAPGISPSLISGRPSFALGTATR